MKRTTRVVVDLEYDDDDAMGLDEDAVERMVEDAITQTWGEHLVGAETAPAILTITEIHTA